MRSSKGYSTLYWSMLTMLLYESGSEFKKIMLLIELLIRNSLIARVNISEPVEVRVYACN